jgi:hypothetical protein
LTFPHNERACLWDIVLFYISISDVLVLQQLSTQFVVLLYTFFYQRVYSFGGDRPFAFHGYSKEENGIVERANHELDSDFI